MSNPNNKNNKNNQDEYQYPNEEYVTETTPAIEEKTTQPSRAQYFLRLIKNNKRVTFIVGVVIAILIVFKCLNWIDHRTVAPTPIATLPAPQATTVSPSPEVLGQLSALKQENQNNATAVSQLQSQIQSVQNEINQSATQQAQLNQSVSALAAQVKQLTEAVSDLGQPVPKHHAPTVIFHVRAILPGRAWITSSDGLSLSVAVGDSVPQYGTVQAIDVNHGMVLTTSGRVIDYGSNDH